MFSLILCFTVLINYSTSSDNFIEWIGGNFDYPSTDSLVLAINNNSYIPRNVIATRGQIYKDNVYVALPRLKPGSPATLAKLGVKPRCPEAVLLPFPNWAAQNYNHTEGLHSIVDIFIDLYGCLWALNSGVINVLDNPIRKCPPRVVAYNLIDGKKVKTLDLSGLVVQGSRLQFLMVDYGTEGKPFVYITDAATRSIIIFDVIESKAYRVVLPKSTLGPKRDILYAVLVRKSCGNNFFVFTYLSSPRIFSICTSYLRSGSATGKIEDLGGKDGKIVILGTDGGSAMFYRYEGSTDIYRWDANRGNFSGGEIVYSSPNCFLATQVLADLKRMKMRVLESNFPDYLAGTVGCGVTQRISAMLSDNFE